MQNVAADIVGQLNSGDILLLYGELGSGKTTFVQGLARALGITDSVTSPTFTIVGEYNVNSLPLSEGEREGVGKAITTLVHVDLYRLDEKNAASDPAVRDVLECASNPGRLTVIEWADRLEKTLPQNAQKLRFEHGKSPKERVLTFL